MKKLPAGRTLLRVAVLLFGISALALGLAIGGFGLELRLPDLGGLSRLFGGERTVVASSVLLEQVRDLYRLNTVEYIHKAVFPHDFLPHSVDPQALARKLAGARSQEAVPLTAAEYEYLETGSLAEELGLSPEKNPTGFLIVTVTALAGFELEGFFTGRGEHEPFLRVEETGRERTAYIDLPDPAITSLIIDDPSSGAYRYPDVRITPSQWKKLAAFVTRRVRPKLLEEGILIDAEEQGRRAVTAFLEQAGFDRVIVVESGA